MFTGFEAETVSVGETSIFIRRKGQGRPLLLLHGFPQTHVMWHRVAPALSEEFTVICADLRGYGASGKPSSGPGHDAYSKRVMAMDMVRMMDAQGFRRFSVAGHDRGARVAYRMALDSDVVERLAVLDIVPTGEALRRVDFDFLMTFWPWSLLAQPAPLPERLVSADPAVVVDDALQNWGSDASAFPPEVRQAYIQALSSIETVHAICEEYRAAATIDRDFDDQDLRAGRRIQCPTLVLWSKRGALDRWYENEGGVTGIWRRWAVDVRGHAIEGGHFFPEQNPTAVTAELRSFFTARN